MKNVVVRVDSSTIMGTGHVMRCLTLANELKMAGAAVTFISRWMANGIAEIIEEQGYVLFQLPPVADSNPHHGSTYEDWLGVTQELDAEQTANILRGVQPIDCLIIDHYALDNKWEQILRPLVRKIMVIDDLANRHHDCDLLLDQNYYSHPQDRYLGLVPSNCIQLLGPQYALLRPEFIQQRKKSRNRDGTVHGLFVFFGGADHSGETEKALEAIIQMKNKEIQIDVVVGASNPSKERIRSICDNHANFHYHYQVNHMAELMNRADLAIGAGGSSTWERCYLGLPSLTVVVAENQLQITEELAEAEITEYLGWYEDLDVEDYAIAIKKALNEPIKLMRMSKNGLGLFHHAFDHTGNHPVVKHIVM